MKTYTYVMLMAALTASACSGTGASHEPVLSAVPSPGYAKDLSHCRTLARSQKIWNPETRTKAALGAGIGALSGAGEDSSLQSEEILAGAAVGAVTGAAVGAIETRHMRRSILLECLRDHGHPVAG